MNDSLFKETHGAYAASPGPRRAAAEAPPQPAASGQRLHIERLVIDGLPLTPAQGHRLQAAIEGELARLLAEPSNAPLAAISVAALRSAAVEFDGTDAAALGRRVAQNLMQSLRCGTLGITGTSRF